MTRTHMALCLGGVGAAVLSVAVFGVSWGTILTVVALLACPAAMYLGMRQMAARPHPRQDGIDGKSTVRDQRSEDDQVHEAPQVR